MFIDLDGQSIFYQRNYGKGNPVLLLHGWGCSARTLGPVFDCFRAQGRDVTAVDFPGFGSSPTPSENFTIYDYAEVIAKLIDALELGKPDVIAHSFGGRVALILAHQGRLNRMVLTGSAGLKPRRSLKYRLKVAKYKLKRRLGIRTDKDGSPDYRALSGSMRKVFVSVVNTHLDRLLSEIATPTLAVWGTRDKETPLYMAKRLEKRLPDCRLVKLKDLSHFAYLEDIRTFNALCTEFLKE